MRARSAPPWLDARTLEWLAEEHDRQAMLGRRNNFLAFTINWHAREAAWLRRVAGIAARKREEPST